MDLGCYAGLVVPFDLLATLGWNPEPLLLVEADGEQQVAANSWPLALEAVDN